MRRLIKRPAARRDLFDIWAHSFENWGEAAADEYLDAIDRAYATIAEHPKIGAECSDIRAGLRRYAARYSNRPCAP